MMEILIRESVALGFTVREKGQKLLIWGTAHGGFNVGGCKSGRPEDNWRSRVGWEAGPDYGENLGKSISQMIWWFLRAWPQWELEHWS